MNGATFYYQKDIYVGQNNRQNAIDWSATI